MGGDHVERGEVELAADLHWIGRPEAVPNVFIADHHGEEGEQGDDAENGSADLTGVDAAAVSNDSVAGAGVADSVTAANEAMPPWQAVSATAPSRQSNNPPRKIRRW